MNDLRINIKNISLQHNDNESTDSDTCFDDSILSQNSLFESDPVIEQQRDPMENFGFGVFSYFSLTQTLVFLFFLYTLCWVPVMFLYAQHQDYG